MGSQLITKISAPYDPAQAGHLEELALFGENVKDLKNKDYGTAIYQILMQHFADSNAFATQVWPAVHTAADGVATSCADVEAVAKHCVKVSVKKERDAARRRRRRRR